MGDIVIGGRYCDLWRSHSHIPMEVAFSSQLSKTLKCDFVTCSVDRVIYSQIWKRKMMTIQVMFWKCSLIKPWSRSVIVHIVVSKIIVNPKKMTIQKKHPLLSLSSISLTCWPLTYIHLANGPMLSSVGFMLLFLGKLSHPNTSWYQEKYHYRMGEGPHHIIQCIFLWFIILFWTIF